MPIWWWGSGGGSDPGTGALGQAILDRMEVLFPELQLQTGESDVTKGLLAANMAQDYMESVFATHSDIFGSTTGTLTTTANTETTTFPSTLLRIDKLQYLEPDTLRPRWDVDLIYETGGHAPSGSWLDAVTSGTGAPRKAYTNGRSFYWDPQPDASYTIRWYGLAHAADLTATGAISYPDLCLTPLAILAIRFVRTGLDDDPAAYLQMAADVFEPVVAALTSFRRDRAPGFAYSYAHET